MKNTQGCFAALALAACLAPFCGAVEIQIGEERRVIEGPLPGSPRAAFGGGVYLLVWQEGWTGLNATADIKALRVKAGSFEPLDKQPFVVCNAPESQEAPVVAFSDGVFLVAWQDFRNGKDYDIRAVLVDGETGKPRGEELALAAKPGNQALPAIAVSGGAFLVAWQELKTRDTYGIVAARVSKDGKVLDAAPIQVCDSGCAPAAGGSGGNFLVTWASGRGINGALIAAETGKVAPVAGKKPGGVNPHCPESASIAGDGRGNFMAVSSREKFPNPWGWPGPGAVLCSRVNADGAAPEDLLDYAWALNNICGRKVPNVIDTATWGKSNTWHAGAPGGFKGTADGLWPNGSASVAYDGKENYLFVWVKGAIASDRLTLLNCDVWLKGMNGKTLAASVPECKAAALETTNEVCPVLVAGPAGEFLLACQQITAGEPRRISLRKITLKE
jgi:hypothetical protein